MPPPSCEPSEFATAAGAAKMTMPRFFSTASVIFFRRDAPPPTVGLPSSRKDHAILRG